MADPEDRLVTQARTITDPSTGQWADVTIVDDGSATSGWVDRFRVTWDPVTGTTHPTFWLNEYGEFRGIPAKSNTVAGRFFAAVDATDLAARDAGTPVFEVTDQRDGVRTTEVAVLQHGRLMVWRGQENIPDDVGWSITPISNVTTAPSLRGATVTYVGTATASGAMSTASGQDRTRHVKHRVTTAAVGAIASARLLQTVHSLANGFVVNAVGGPDTGTSIAGDRFFMGLRASTAAPTDVDPSTMTSILGIGWDAADTEVQVMQNSASGAATKTSTGWAVPSVDSQTMYHLHLYARAGATEVGYKVTDLHTGLVVRGTLAGDLPAAATFMGYQAYHSTGATSSVVGLATGSCSGRDLYRVEA